MIYLRIPPKAMLAKISVANNDIQPVAHCVNLKKSHQPWWRIMTEKSSVVRQHQQERPQVLLISSMIENVPHDSVAHLVAHLPVAHL